MRKLKLKRIGLLCAGFFLLLGTDKAQAQTDTSYVQIIPAPKKFDHFIGVQVNLLVQQVFNFGDAPENGNPYLLKYSLRHNSSNWALNAGFGIDSETSENDQGFKRTNDSFNGRIGLGYQKTIAKNFEIGIGADFVYGYQSQETFSVQVVNNFEVTDSTITTSSNKLTQIGGGLQASMQYVFAKRFTIGTEMSLYYTANTEKFNATSESFVSHSGNIINSSINATNESSDGREFRFQVPIAIFVSFKF